VGAARVSCADRQDMAQLIIALRNFANAPKIEGQQTEEQDGVG